MDRLILLRHGKAETDAPTGQDFDRALTGRGRRDAALVAREAGHGGVVGFPPGAAAVVDFAPKGHRRARAFSLYTPKALGGGQ